MPQMMPIYWFLMFLIVNLFVHFILSSYYFNFLLFEGFLKKGNKSVGSKVNYIKY
uniref:ATP synthase complex subunit 8 n=1 Tax=Coloceras sp. SLC-2011 TaxID=1075158 RepID=G1EN61_9NEOP|nr:ATP synthase F0 subunit 8 [Coloceras sp. SLC-2011]